MGKGYAVGCWWLLIIHFIYLLRALSLFSTPFVRCLAHCSRGGLDLAVWVRVRFLSPFSSRLRLHGHRPVTSPVVINETCWWLLPLPILVQNHSGDCSVTVGLVPLFPHLLGSRPRRYLFGDNSAWNRSGEQPANKTRSIVKLKFILLIIIRNSFYCLCSFWYLKHVWMEHYQD